MSKPQIIQVIDEFGIGKGGAEIYVDGEQVALVFKPPSSAQGRPMTFRFGLEVAKRLAEGLDQAAKRLAVKLV